MTPQIERRRAERRADESPSPEYLALLEVCGGEIRASDRALLAEWRRAAGTGESGAPPAQSEVTADAAAPAMDRRAGST